MDLKTFVNTCVTTSGVAKTITNVHQNPQGQVIRLEGTVTPNNTDGTPGTATIPMMWNAAGAAFVKQDVGPQYDLVVKSSVADYFADPK